MLSAIILLIGLLLLALLVKHAVNIIKGAIRIVKAFLTIKSARSSILNMLLGLVSVIVVAPIVTAAYGGTDDTVATVIMITVLLGVIVFSQEANKVAKKAIGE